MSRGITVDELKECKLSVSLWSGGKADFDGLFQGYNTTPVGVLANRRCPGLLALLRLYSNGMSYEKLRVSLSLDQRNAIAHATFDWTEWTIYHGLGPGIMTALQNGQKEEILAAIDADLKKAERDARFWEIVDVATKVWGLDGKRKREVLNDD